MSPASLLTRVGKALFGDRWKADLAHALGVTVDRLDAWSKGEGQPPPGVWRDLAGFIQEREQSLQPLKANVLRLVESLDQAGQKRH